MDILLFLPVAVLLYWIPGWLFLAAIGVRGTNRWERLFLALPVSLVIVPLYLAMLSNIVPFRPTIWALLPLVLALAGLALWRARAGRPEAIGIRARTVQAPGRLENILGWAAAFGFALMICLPRMDFFINGATARWGGSGDAYWHLSELVSVAVSGLAPKHYFFPDLTLIYYYWSWMIPAILVNLSEWMAPPTRALAFHAFLQSFAFAGLAWFFLSKNYSGRVARWVGLWGVTIAGGFDYFLTFNIQKYEDWQRRVNWIVSNNQVSAFPTLYLWVEQHLAGAMALLLALFIARNVRAPLLLRAIGIAAAAAYCLGTSAFIFLSAALIGVLWAIWFRRAWWRRAAIPALLAGAAVFLVASWRQLIMTLGQSGGMAWNEFRVPLLENFMQQMESARWQLADRILTLVGFPVPAFWVILVEIGFPFLLYAIWLFAVGFRGPSRWNKVLAVFPLVYIFLTLLLTHSGPGRNFITRGMIPVQLVVLLCAVDLLSRVRWRTLPVWSAVLGGYALAAAILFQSVGPLIDWRNRTMVAVGNLLQASAKVEWAGVEVGLRMEAWPESLAYIRWLNAHTPLDAFVVESGSITDDTAFRMLQRMRYLPPSSADTLSMIFTDLEQTSESEWNALKETVAGKTALEQALDSAYLRSHPGLPVYIVLRGGEPDVPGELVYADDFVRIILLQSR